MALRRNSLRHERQGVRLCGGDEGAVKTDEVCDRPLAPFGFVPSKLQYDIVTYRNEKSTKIKTSAKSQVWECAPEGFQRATANFVCFHALWSPPQRRNPCVQKQIRMRKVHPQKQKIAIGQAFRSRWHFSGSSRNLGGRAAWRRVCGRAKLLAGTLRCLRLC